MSNQTFSKAEISEIAIALYKELGSDFFDTYEDQQVAKSEAAHELKVFDKPNDKPRDELLIRLDKFRWFFESIALANKLQTFKTYSKYGDIKQIEYDEIEVLDGKGTINLSKTELLNKLQLLSYNCDEFLSKKNSEKLDGYIEQISDRIIREIKN